MKAWRLNSNEIVAEQQLKNIGVLHFTIKESSEIDALCKERNYKNRDEVIISPTVMGEEYKAKMEMFFTEHLHEDEEIRFVLDGEGYFDVRCKDDDWIRYVSRGKTR
jgi:1,2-dihydroxy-3-keto-5-methylthiopentene dioxygenase